MGNCVSILGDIIIGRGYFVGFFVGCLVSLSSVGLYVVGCIVGISLVSSSVFVGDSDKSVAGEGGRWCITV